MNDGWEGLENVATDVRDSQQAAEDLWLRGWSKTNEVA